MGVADNDKLRPHFLGAKRIHFDLLALNTILYSKAYESQSLSIDLIALAVGANNTMSSAQCHMTFIFDFSVNKRCHINKSPTTYHANIGSLRIFEVGSTTLCTFRVLDVRHSNLSCRQCVANCFQSAVFVALFITMSRYLSRR